MYHNSLIGLLLWFPLLGISQTGYKTVSRPNIILIMCDDLGWADVGFNGNRIVKTPNLDLLAAKGMVLDRFYSAAPVCSPTRASCLTGRNPYRMGVYSANVGHLRDGEITIPEILSEHGYATGHFGKWHLGTLTTEIYDANRGEPNDTIDYAIPTEHGYDEYFCTESKVPTWDPMLKPVHFRSDLSESLRYGWFALEDGRPAQNYGTFYWSGEEKISLENLEGDNSRVIMDRVVPFMQRSVKNQAPFFTTVWLHTPHLPLVTGSAYRDLYLDLTDEEQLFYGAISAMDEQVGRLMDELNQLQIADETIIFFCSDNGPERETPGSAGVFRDRKRSLYEGGVRVPAFCVWPDHIEAGGRNGTPMVTSDYLPTILNLLDIEYPDHHRELDGLSMRSVILRNEEERLYPIGFQFTNDRKSWVDNQFKLITMNGKNFELYNLHDDPSENHDIAKSHPEIVAKMKSELHQWVKSCKASDQGLDYDN